MARIFIGAVGKLLDKKFDFKDRFPKIAKNYKN